MANASPGISTGLSRPSSYNSVHSNVLGDGLYTQEKVKHLEEYLQLQVKEGSYDFEANKSLLKLYLLYPPLANNENVETILLKALLNLPATDFTLLLYILPEKLQTDENVLTIKDAAEALETARYADFWSILNSRAAVFLAIPEWKDDIRKIILTVHAATYKAVDKAHVSDGVGLSGDELDSFLTANTPGLVAKVEVDRVIFAPNKENQPWVRKYKEKVDLQNMLGILNRLAA
ncbi:hypothetical protein NSK_001169 [Nannochloropsis salina CCMP1776]|uniref:Eukaryotic translation initiation factor 3 subunit K n=1 Tax=Nannochloropsis salina CCMP1776 TaxID=1027361 RepID=A0A4D9D8A0_9STRA|nr:hypothetical protein NSK_001169 [Nannochloropsis salina CCMP1776]|eukprot:TFJ87822.1 hypothetical protein NSK_001169 [Nannochloropsis salina CCMP1776]